MDEVEREYEDFRVLATALRNRIAREGHLNRASIMVEIEALICRVEAVGTSDDRFLSALDIARSLLVLGRPADALDSVDVLLSDVKNTGTKLTRRI